MGESNAVQEMVPLLKSMILLATAPFRVVFITDDTGKEKLVNLTSSHLMDRSTMLQHVDVRFFANGTKEIEEQARQSIQWENIHHSGVWSFIKMLLPWIAPEYDRLAIVDTDLVFVTDPIELWREFDPPYQHQRDWLYSFPTNETLKRGSYNISGIRWSVSICSCIGLLEAAKIRRGTRVFPEAFMAAQRLHIKEKKKRNHNLSAHPYSENGDQSVYWNMFQLNETWLAPLHERWNRNKCQSYANAFSVKKATGMLHQNCGDFSGQKGSSPVKDEAFVHFDYFDSYPWHWFTPIMHPGQLPTSITVQTIPELSIFHNM